MSAKPASAPPRLPLATVRERIACLIELLEHNEISPGQAAGALRWLLPHLRRSDAGQPRKPRGHQS